MTIKKFNHMKTTILILGIAAIFTLFTACQDWLDMPSESKADSSSIFATINRAEMTVVGAYPFLHTQELGYQLLMGTDESSSTESNSKYVMSNYDYTNLTGMLNSTYTTMYKAIEYANVCVANLPSMQASSENDQKKIDALLGESLAIRAYAYWNLVRFFGDVPFSLVPTSELTTFSSSRVSRDTIWDQCVADLQQAIELLPWKSEGMVATAERFTKNSAYGILARVALYAAGYSLRWDLSMVPYNKSSVMIAKRDDQSRVRELLQIAADASAAVIARNENHLLSDYDQVFRDLALEQYNDESMLEYGWYGPNSVDVRMGYTNGIPTSGTSDTFGKGGPQMITMPTLYFEFEEGDQRRDVAVCNFGILSNDDLQMSTYIGTCVGKYRIDWMKDRGASDSKRNINFPLLRYSDVLLMYAEALNELNNGPTADEINAFRTVRLRAFRNDASKIGTIPSDYDGFKEAIIKERKLELSNESLRKTDLTRWGILYEHLTAEKEKLYQLARREGAYTNVDVYRAYKTVKGVLQNPVIAVPFVSMRDADIASLNLSASEMTTLNTLNFSSKGYLPKTFYENKSNGEVYFTESAIPAGTEVTAASMLLRIEYAGHLFLR